MSALNDIMRVFIVPQVGVHCVPIWSTVNTMPVHTEFSEICIFLF